MTLKNHRIGRRQFIKQGAFAAGSLLFLTDSKLANNKGENVGKSRVILIRNQQVLAEGGVLNQEVLGKMLDQGLLAVTGEKETKAAWQKIIKKDDRVGIKTNAWANLPTPKELEELLKERMMKFAGVIDVNIKIADKGLTNDEFFQTASALINVRPMRAHHWAGVGSLIKNYITFVDNRPDYHPDACADLGKIWVDQKLLARTRLNILVMLTPQFHGVGPHSFNPMYVWKYYGLLMGFDPVAVDTVGLRIIEAKRKEYFNDDRPLNPPAKHILAAGQKYKLGQADFNAIELIKLGDSQDILI